MLAACSDGDTAATSSGERRSDKRPWVMPDEGRRHTRTWVAFAAGEAIWGARRSERRVGGELRASAALTPALQQPLRASTAAWDRDVEDLVTRIPDAITTDPAATAARLTALVEGLSERWHSGSIELARARDLLRGAIEHEVGPRQPA